MISECCNQSFIKGTETYFPPYPFYTEELPLYGTCSCCLILAKGITKYENEQIHLEAFIKANEKIIDLNKLKYELYNNESAFA